MKTKLTIVLSFVLLLLVSGAAYTYSNTSETDHHEDEDDVVASYEIYPGDLVDKLEKKENIVLLDVRTLEEHEVIHLEGSLFLPVQELSQKSLTDIGLGVESKDKEIYVYCRSGARSKTAYDIMTSLGYTNVKSVAGGMIHWEEDEYPFTEVGEYVSTQPQSETNASLPAPKITTDRSLHTFGVIAQYGGVVETSFIISNTGDATLVLGDISTSCSCTSAEVENTTVEVGESTKLTVFFDPDFHEEPLDEFKRTVFIQTNDPTTPELEIQVKVDIAEGE